MPRKCFAFLRGECNRSKSIELKTEVYLQLSIDSRCWRLCQCFRAVDRCHWWQKADPDHDVTSSSFICSSRRRRCAPTQKPHSKIWKSLFVFVVFVTNSEPIFVWLYDTVWFWKLNRGFCGMMFWILRVAVLIQFTHNCLGWNWWRNNFIKRWRVFILNRRNVRVARWIVISFDINLSGAIWWKWKIWKY